jgi:acetylxylan esterase
MELCEYLRRSIFREINQARHSDTTLYYQNFLEEIKQWTNLHGLSQDATTTTENDPEANFTKTTYGDQVVAYSAAGTTHDIKIHAEVDLAWFGLL